MSPEENKSTMPNSPSFVRRRQLRNLFIIVGVLGALILSSVWLAGSESDAKKEETLPTSTLIPVTMSSAHIDDHTLWLHRAESALNQVKKDTENLKEKFDKTMKEKMVEETHYQNTDKRMTTLEEQLKKLQAAQDARNAASTPSGYGIDGKVLPVLPSPHGSGFSPVKKEELALAPLISEEASSEKNAKTYVPAGTFTKAVLLSGLDASAGVTSQTQPRPVVLRVMDAGTLPNHQRSHLKGCLVTGAGYGDISSERVYIRLERLSCAKKNKPILDIPVYGYVSGPDGKAGVRGRAIWREGILLQRSFVSGLLSGLGQGVAGAYTNTSVSSQGALQSVDPSNLLKVSMATGTSTALGKLAEYNIRRAEQYQPVIEVSATPVTVVFHTGFYLDGHKDEKLSQAVQEVAAPSPS